MRIFLLLLLICSCFTTYKHFTSIKVPKLSSDEDDNFSFNQNDDDLFVTKFSNFDNATINIYSVKSKKVLREFDLTQDCISMASYDNVYLFGHSESPSKKEKVNIVTVYDYDSEEFTHIEEVEADKYGIGAMSVRFADSGKKFVIYVGKYTKDMELKSSYVKSFDVDGFSGSVIFDGKEVDDLIGYSDDTIYLYKFNLVGFMQMVNASALAIDDTTGDVVENFIKLRDDKIFASADVDEKRMMVAYTKDDWSKFYISMYDKKTGKSVFYKAQEQMLSELCFVKGQNMYFGYPPNQDLVFVDIEAKKEVQRIDSDDFIGDCFIGNVQFSATGKYLGVLLIDEEGDGKCKQSIEIFAYEK